jgi:hypothetical protein
MTTLRLRSLPGDCDGERRQARTPSPCPGGRSWRLLHLYALQDQHTPSGRKGPGKVDPRSRWQQGEHWHAMAAIGRAPRSRM